MSKEEKELLLVDLCARLPYGVKATTTSDGWKGVYTITGYANERIYLDCPVYDEGDDEWLVEFIKPHLRPMSSMTEEEKNEYNRLCGYCLEQDAVDYNISILDRAQLVFVIDWLNSHHFDYRGLIEKGLALEAPEGMYSKQ